MLYFYFFNRMWGAHPYFTSFYKIWGCVLPVHPCPPLSLQLINFNCKPGQITGRGHGNLFQCFRENLIFGNPPLGCAHEFCLYVIIPGHSLLPVSLLNDVCAFCLRRHTSKSLNKLSDNDMLNRMKYSSVSTYKI